MSAQRDGANEQDETGASHEGDSKAAQGEAPDTLEEARNDGGRSAEARRLLQKELLEDDDTRR